MSSSELQSVKDSTDTHTTFARGIMGCVFNEAAIRQCSLKGGSSNGKGSTNKENENIARRPGLYKPGLIAVIS